MRFCTQQHQHYCGIDLHARTMYLCILNPAGEVLLHRNLRAAPEAFLQAITAYRQDLVVQPYCPVLPNQPAWCLVSSTARGLKNWCRVSITYRIVSGVLPARCTDAGARRPSGPRGACGRPLIARTLRI